MARFVFDECHVPTVGGETVVPSQTPTRFIQERPFSWQKSGNVTKISENFDNISNASKNQFFFHKLTIQKHRIDKQLAEQSFISGIVTLNPPPPKKTTLFFFLQILSFHQ